MDVLDTVKNATLEGSRAKKMPSGSPSQARLMAASAHTPGGYDGVPQSVGQDFNSADTGGSMLMQAMHNQMHGAKTQKKMKGAQHGGNGFPNRAANPANR